MSATPPYISHSGYTAGVKTQVRHVWQGNLWLIEAYIIKHSWAKLGWKLWSQRVTGM